MNAKDPLERTAARQDEPHQPFGARGARLSLAALNFASPVRTPAV